MPDTFLAEYCQSQGGSEWPLTEAAITRVSGSSVNKLPSCMLKKRNFFKYYFCLLPTLRVVVTRRPVVNIDLQGSAADVLATARRQLMSRCLKVVPQQVSGTVGALYPPSLFMMLSC